MFVGFYKTRHFAEGANCTVLRAVVLTQYRRQTDGQTDGNAIASAALEMRALRSTVKIIASCKGGTFFETQCSISVRTS